MTLASILVVDDDANSRSLIANGLRELGHYVSESENAGSALAEVQRRQPDLMILVGKPTDMPELLARMDGNVNRQKNPAMPGATGHPMATSSRSIRST